MRQEEVQIQVVERRKMIEVEAQEVLRKEKALRAEIELPANAEQFRIETNAEAEM